MKKIICLFAIIFFAISGFCQQYVMTSNGYTIEGQVKKGSGYVTLRTFLRDGNELLDSTTMDKKGRFYFRGNTEENIPCLLTINGGKSYRLYLEPGMNMKMEINPKKDRFEVNKECKETLRWYSIVNPEHQEDANVYLERIENFVLNNPEDIFSSDLIASYLSYYWSKDELMKCLNTLKGEGTKTYHYIHLRDRENDLENIAVGSKAKNIEKTSSRNRGESLASLCKSKKYVLVYFWASWSKNSMEQIQNLNAIYKNYKNKGFGVYAVSLDKNEKEWRDGIKQNSMEWTNVCDFKMWEGDAVKQYMVKSLPYNVLVDNNGSIVAANLEMNALNTMLSDLLEKESYNISGNIKGITEGIVKLDLLLKGGRRESFTTRMKNGDFSFTGEVERVCMGMITLPIKDGVISFFMDNDNITIKGDKNNLEAVRIEGSETEKQFMNIAYSCNNNRNPMQCLMNYVADNPESIYSPFIISNYLYPYMSEQDRMEAVSSLKGDAEDMYQYYLLTKQIGDEMASKDLVSEKAKDFTLPNLNDEDVNLYQYISFNNYTLLNFWASWDVKARNLNIDYARIFNNYSKKYKFGIISVSLDDNKFLWRKAVENDGIGKWENVSDLKRWSSSVVRLYDLPEIPYSMLLDKNGNIVGKNLSLSEIINIISK